MSIKIKLTVLFFTLFSFACTRKAFYLHSYKHECFNSSFEKQSNIKEEKEENATTISLVNNGLSRDSLDSEISKFNPLDKEKAQDSISKPFEFVSFEPRKVSENDKKSENNTVKSTNIDGRKYHPLAIIAFVTSILGFLFFPLEFAAFVMGIIGLHKINKKNNEYRGKGFAITAIVLGSLAILLTLIVITILIILLSTGGFY